MHRPVVVRTWGFVCVARFFLHGGIVRSWGGPDAKKRRVHDKLTFGCCHHAKWGQSRTYLQAPLVDRRLKAKAFYRL
ncbi:hypothetical protein GCM10010331_35200 [Streptomyces xanthochromogenes]|nr:hypothetical protein GCM10010331_35200 [Streptomyces xanthochromogenes]